MHDRGVTDDSLLGLDCPSRRGVLRTLAGIGVTTIGAGVLVACGAGTDGASTEGGSADGSGDGTTGPTEASVPLAEVPVGEAVVVDALGARMVVAQPSAGQVVAFSARCTHAGTTVEAVGGLDLRCPNHGSRFDAADGAATQGPATEPLPPVDARIEGDLVVLTA
jgi:nitrite reductase/ring-hydroxylating ferredoxin subunit